MDLPDRVLPLPGPDDESVEFIEQRSAPDTLTFLLVAVLGTAVLRGLERSPVVAGLLGVLALVIVASWGWWRLRPVAVLTISPYIVSVRRGEMVRGELLHVDGASARVSRTRSGAFLVLDGPERIVISLTGFDDRRIERALTGAGWGAAGGV